MTNSTTSLIRPGLLVSFKTSVRGGITYETRPLGLEGEPEAAPADEAGSTARWETTRHIADVAEHELGNQTRSRIRTLVLRECYSTSFGLLCPDANETALQAAIDESRELAKGFNEKAKHSKIVVHLLIGRIASTDEQAARAIADETRGLLDDMERAVRAADPRAIREAAAAAREAAGMLNEDTRRKVGEAINEVRAIAREITRRVEKAGEAAATVVEGVKLSALMSARFAVLDVDGGGEVVAMPTAAPAVDLQAAEDATPAERAAADGFGVAPQQADEVEVPRVANPFAMPTPAFEL